MLLLACVKWKVVHFLIFICNNPCMFYLLKQTNLNGELIHHHQFNNLLINHHPRQFNMTFISSNKIYSKESLPFFIFISKGDDFFGLMILEKYFILYLFQIKSFLCFFIHTNSSNLKNIDLIVSVKFICFIYIY